MSYEDFMNHFASVNVCKTTDCNEIRIKGKFLRMLEEEKYTDNVVSKWFYCMNLVNKTHLQIGIHQVDEKIKRVKERRFNLDTAVMILKRGMDGTLVH